MEENNENYSLEQINDFMVPISMNIFKDFLRFYVTTKKLQIFPEDILVEQKQFLIDVLHYYGMVEEITDEYLWQIMFGKYDRCFYTRKFSSEKKSFGHFAFFQEQNEKLQRLRMLYIGYLQQFVSYEELFFAFQDYFYTRLDEYGKLAHEEVLKLTRSVIVEGEER